MTPMLSVRASSKRFGGLTALDGVSFDVPTGAIVGLMGANGAGKTTLFSLIAGNARPSGGDIRFQGHSIVGLRPDQICRLGVARTFQIVKPFPNLTVLREPAHRGDCSATRSTPARQPPMRRRSACSRKSAWPTWRSARRPRSRCRARSASRSRVPSPPAGNS